MGADNISHIAVFPNPIRQVNINKMRKYLAEVKIFIEGLTDEHINQFCKAQNKREGIANLVGGICLVNDYAFSKETQFKIVNAILCIKDSGDDIRYPEELDVDPPYGTGYRDSASRTVRLGGKTWDIVSCGEMSWGDEPSGSGYRELKQAFRWGVVQILGGQ